MAGAKKELARMVQYARPRFPFERMYGEFRNHNKADPTEHITSLKNYIQIAPFLIPKDRESHWPIIRHTDPHPPNILVSDDPKIVGMIDWQHCYVLPLLSQAGIPKYFRNYGNEESERLTTLRLSNNLAELIEEEKVTAMEQWSKHHIHSYYLAASANLNKVHFRTRMEDRSIFRSRIFQHAGKLWEGDSVTLKADLIQVMQD